MGLIGVEEKNGEGTIVGPQIVTAPVYGAWQKIKNHWIRKQVKQNKCKQPRLCRFGKRD